MDSIRAPASTSGLDEYPTHHPTYYLKDGVIFLVEKQLFRVPRYMLEIASPVFADLFSLPQPTGTEAVEGSIDTRPICLEQVESIDFERLLGFLYPLTTQYESFTESWGTNEWRSILRLAAKWEMTAIQARAIENLERLGSFPSALEKVLAGWEYGHVPWLKKGFLGLIKRSEPLNQEESAQLGLEYAVKCATAREASLREKIRQAQARNHYNSVALPGIFMLKTDEQIMNEVFTEFRLLDHTKSHA